MASEQLVDVMRQQIEHTYASADFFRIFLEILIKSKTFGLVEMFNFCLPIVNRFKSDLDFTRKNNPPGLGFSLSQPKLEETCGDLCAMARSGFSSRAEIFFSYYPYLPEGESINFIVLFWKSKTNGNKDPESSCFSLKRFFPQGKIEVQASFQGPLFEKAPGIA